MFITFVYEEFIKTHSLAMLFLHNCTTSQVARQDRSLISTWCLWQRPVLWKWYYDGCCQGLNMLLALSWITFTCWDQLRFVLLMWHGYLSQSAYDSDVCVIFVPEHFGPTRYYIMIYRLWINNAQPYMVGKAKVI